MSLLAENPNLPSLKQTLVDINGEAATPEDLLELQRLRQMQLMRQETHEALNGQGFVKFVDCFGSDDRVVGAARLTAQSHGHTFNDDRTLLRYLMRHLHTTPVEFGEIVVHVRVPMDCWRQWIRHRTATVNEFSTRYSPAIDEKATTPEDQWRLQSQGNRQGSSGDVVTEWPAKYADEPPEGFSLADGPGYYLSQREKELHGLVDEVYNERLEFGVAKEVARKDLTLSTFTEAFWKIDLHNLFHFLYLRMDSHAQQEIRDYANIVGEQIVAKLFPVAWEAFLDYRHNAMLLTALDIEVIQRMAALSGGVNLPDQEDFLEHQHDSWKSLTRCRERVECWTKLAKLRIVEHNKDKPDIT